MKKIIYCIVVVMGLILSGCSKQEPEVLEDNILKKFNRTTDEKILKHYESIIADCEMLDAAYDVNYISYDLNDDGIGEDISYLLSALNGGSIGNITLDIYDNDKNIGLSESIYLNPHMDEEGNYAKYEVALQILNHKTNSFHDLRYVTKRVDDGSITKGTTFQFNNNSYIKTQ